MNKVTIGVDIGGTNVKMGLVSAKGKILARHHFPTKQYTRQRVKLINALIAHLKDLMKKHHLQLRDVTGVGIGLPGAVDPRKGVVLYLPNVPGWKNVPLRSLLSRELGMKIYLENDVNMITLGEWKYGAGRGVKNLVCMTLGTGVGGGLVLDGKIYRGEGYAAGEIGHIPLNEQGPACSCGGYGCFERYVGNKYIQEKGAKIFKQKNIRIEDIYKLAGEGNVRALHLWDEIAAHIGNGLVGVVNLLNPQLIIIGGGVSNNYRYLYKTIKATINRRAMPVQRHMVKIVRAELGDDAGILGANVLVMDKNID